MHNPYSITRLPPPSFIPRVDDRGRDVVARMVARLLDPAHGSVAVVANHGMGKTLLADRVEALLQGQLEIVHVDCKTMSTDDAATRLRAALGLPADAPLDQATDYPERPVLLWLDEVDPWFRQPSSLVASQRLFSEIKAAMERLRRLRLAITGGVVVLSSDQPFGSGLVGRLELVIMRPMSVADLDTMIAWGSERPGWVAAMEARRTPIAAFSGGCPLLMMWALAFFWDEPEAGPQDLLEEHRASNVAYVRQVLQAVGKGHEDLEHIFELAQEIAGQEDQVRVRSLAVARRIDTETTWTTETALAVLRASGMVDVRYIDGEAWVARRLGVMMDTLMSGRPAPGPPVERLRRALGTVLGAIHRFQLDMRTGTGNTRRPLEEGAWSAMIAVGLCGAGWTVVRETVSGAGRADLGVMLEEGTVVIEVKRGDNPDLSALPGPLERQHTVNVAAMWSVTIGRLAEEARWRRAVGLEGEASRARTVQHQDPQGRVHWFLRLQDG